MLLDYVQGKESYSVSWKGFKVKFCIFLFDFEYSFFLLLNSKKVNGNKFFNITYSENNFRFSIFKISFE